MAATVEPTFVHCKISKFTDTRFVMNLRKRKVTKKNNNPNPNFRIYEIHIKTLLFFCRGKVYVDYDVYEERIHYYFSPPEDQRYFLFLWAVPGSSPGPQDQPTCLLPSRILQVCLAAINSLTPRFHFSGKYCQWFQ